ncbi:MAG TPA: AbiV family abortive infection protein [Sedimentisphaerales bacterium]|nr:AbiV family abortive infection protein [Sedimentisphaerales bacterium]
MKNIQSILDKVRRVARASFENAVRLHEDAVLLFDEERIPSALHTTALSIEELGKYFLYEEVWWHNMSDPKWDEVEIQRWLRSTYSHTAKQTWFAGQAKDFFVSKTVVQILVTGELEQIKQKSTYVGLPRKKIGVDFRKRLMTPFRASKKRTMDLITAVNDYLIVLSLGIRKGAYMVELPEIDDLLAEQSFERHFRELWPHMRPSTKRHIAKLEKLEDDPER